MGPCFCSSVSVPSWCSCARTRSPFARNSRREESAAARESVMVLVLGQGQWARSAKPS